jgi:hypothetical protein
VPTNHLLLAGESAFQASTTQTTTRNVSTTTHFFIKPALLARIRPGVVQAQDTPGLPSTSGANINPIN